MDNFDQQEELSKDDLEVLETFHNLDFSAQDSVFPGDLIATTPQTDQTNSDQSGEDLSEDDLLALFATEADEDITAMGQAFQQLAQDKQFDPHRLKVLKRCAHKVAGTAGAIGCASMSTISHYIETIITCFEAGNLTSESTLRALSTSIQALEKTLLSIVSDGFESKNPLMELEVAFQELQIDVHSGQTALSALYETTGNSSLEEVLHQTRGHESESPALHVNERHFRKLLESAESLTELDSLIEQAQKQVEIALNELQFAQSRLRRLEPLLTSLALSGTGDLPGNSVQDAGYPPSSLVARILQEASIRNGYISPTQSAERPQSILMQEADLWDEMQIDRISEKNVLAHAFNEAMNDVALATTHLRQALKNHSTLVLQHVGQAKLVSQEAFMLRSLPFSLLTSRVQAAIEMIAGEQRERINLEVSGESVEINQDVLEKLVDPLVEFIQMQTAEFLYFKRSSDLEAGESLHIACKAHGTNNEINVEISFSQSISSGLVANLQDTVHQLYGSISQQEKNSGHRTLQLRLPRELRNIQGLLVRAGNQQILVPVSQVQRIYFHTPATQERSTRTQNSHEELIAGGYDIYYLNALLGLQDQAQHAQDAIKTALLLELDHPGIAIVVDEVVTEVEMHMKPLPAYLCRPGITSSAFDGNGNIVLVLNFPQIIQEHALYKHVEKANIVHETTSAYGSPLPASKSAVCQRVLIADDSIFIRQSLHMNLDHEGYVMVEAKDGLETLDQLAKESPDLLLLDVEMPNLNGYDVLSIVRSHLEYSALKIIMLTSRSSERHKRRALELGADAYLMKPCSHDVLLQTIKTLFEDPDIQET